MKWQKNVKYTNILIIASTHACSTEMQHYTHMCILQKFKDHFNNTHI